MPAESKHKDLDITDDNLYLEAICNFQEKYCKETWPFSHTETYIYMIYITCIYNLYLYLQLFEKVIQSKQAYTHTSLSC